ncbi:MAG: glycosyltransferase [Candidatus Magasanikbacteria bacterium]|nr:glycosyltransferase [Candidatus Magasanikbacteria bacterium]
MRLGIDARFYSEAGGLGRYTQELLKELEKQDTSNFYIVFVNQDGWKDYQPQNPKFQKVLADVKWYTLTEQLKMGGIIKKQKIDLMHFLHWNIPFLYRQPFIVTIHDLILLKYPSRQASTLGPVKYWIKNLGYKLILRHAILNAKKILTPSHFVKKDILENFQINSEKIIVTYEGITNFSQTNQNSELLHQLNITKPYFLYVGVS